MFTNYTNCLPAWSVGPNCYEKVYGVVAKFGKSAAVIGGKTALSKAYPAGSSGRHRFQTQ